jgi:hypothetical protein
MSDGVTGDLLDALSQPIVSTDQKYIIRGSQTFRAPVTDIPTLVMCLNGSYGSNGRIAFTNDPRYGWDLVSTPTFFNGSQSTYDNLLWVPELELFFAVQASVGLGNNSNGIIRSRDAKFWRGNAALASVTPRQITYAPSLGMLACASDTGATTTTGRVITSVDGGITWVARTLPTASVSLFGIAWSPTLSLFAAVGSANAIYTSPDGVTWTQRTGPGTSHNMFQVKWFPSPVSKFIATTNADFHGDLVASSDGITWTNMTMGSGQISFTETIEYSPALGMLMTNNSNGAEVSYSTNNGSTWTIATLTGANKLHGLAWSASLALWVASTEESVNIYTSPNGSTWTAWQTPAVVTWRRVVASR